MLNRIFNLFFPKICLHCGKKLTREETLICDDCQNSLIFRNQTLCQKCGTELKSNKCEMCEELDYSFDRAFSAYNYSKTMKSLIHAIKYKEMKNTGKFLAVKLFEYWEKHVKINDIDYVIPVPLHKVKKRMRGYNQAEIIGKNFAKLIGFKFDNSLLIRKYFTKTQTRLTKLQRKENINDAFKILSQDKIKDKKILIIDDVFTTGSTVNEMSRILKKFKAEDIYVLTVARA